LKVAEQDRDNPHLVRELVMVRETLVWLRHGRETAARTVLVSPIRGV
jgi:hypothetical protein